MTVILLVRQEIASMDMAKRKVLHHLELCHIGRIKDVGIFHERKNFNSIKSSLMSLTREDLTSESVEAL